MTTRSRQIRLPGLAETDDEGSAPPTESTSEPAKQSPPAVPSPSRAQERAAQPCELGPPLVRPTSLAGQTVYVIDANSLIFQVFHAIPEMTSPRGEPVNAVFGFVRDILYIAQEKEPNYLFCAFDMAGPTFRHELYADYKVHRTEMPDELVPQFPAIRRVLETLGVPILELEGFEADDILATLARVTEELGGECFLVTADKDCRQLITERVKVYNVRKNLIYDAAELAKEWGVAPGQVVDFQALVGDPVDHVPGVPLIGPKIARELLQKYGTLEGVLDHAHEVSGAKRKQNLIDSREQALLSRQLVRLDSQVPIEIDWARGRLGGFDRERALAIFAEYGFHRFGEQLKQLNVSEAPPTWQADYRLVNTPAAFDEFLAALRRQSCISIDTETTSAAATQADLVGFSFAWHPGEAYYLPVRAPVGEPRLDVDAVLAGLRPILEDPAVSKIGQNLKYEILVLRAAGIELKGLTFDSMVASYLLDAGERNHNLDELAQRYLNHATIRITELIGTGKDQKRMDEVPLAAIASYAGEDADVPLRLMPILAPRLSEQGLSSLFDDLELPLIDVLAEMEHNGIRVDVERLKELSDQYGERLARLEREIYELAGHPFNIGSTKQLQQVLFEEQKLPVISKGKTGPSTDVSVLEELAEHHPLPAKIIEYRQFAKLKNTYVDALPELINPRTGRVHASFQQAVAATGRLSSSDPNLQNIPIRTDDGRAIRSAFWPAHEGWSLLAADYSQIELRVLAHFSGDETLCAAFASDEDVHARVASQVYGVPLEEVTAEMRRTAKAVNFGVIYGQSPFGLAKALGIEQDVAATFISNYFDRHRGVEEFLRQILVECREKGYVNTILGRRRAIRGVRPDPGRQRNLSERTAINTVIQGSAADLIKLAMIAVHRRMSREGVHSKLLLQIHDELVFEVAPDEVERMKELVVAEMAGVRQLAVPLKVDVAVGRNWAEAE
ncbi:MAG TPA: DNA polymerase I [Pirellulales bacterium]|nr:DNA polymerase I [Pirellulales bacterium]